MVEARVVRWGNSRGVRIPRPMLEQAGIVEDVTLEVREGEIVIRPAEAHPRQGWADAFREIAALGERPAWPDDMVDTFEEELPEW